MTKFPLFYPIVPNLEWLKKFVPLGVDLIQLRIKDAPLSNIRLQIQESLKITRAYQCQLVINDYWKMAIDLGGDFVHLGQEDIAAVDHIALKRANIKLGISTHSEEELDIALSFNPTYVALGPIYETRLKVLKWAPQGLSRITEWRHRIGSIPLVAIGGLTPERAQGVLSAGADSLAVITDIFASTDPLARVKQWLNTVRLQQSVVNI